MHDLRFAFRQLLKSPAFTAVALITLALGIGANAALFSIMDRLLYRPLPVPTPERLVILAAATPNGKTYTEFNYPLFEDYARSQTVLEAVCATGSVPVGIGPRGATERRHALVVSRNYFSMLHVDAALGRTFAENEGVQLDDAAVLVLSHHLWEIQFGADPRIVGQSVVVNGRPFTVVGIAPREFTGTNRGEVIDVYVPMTMYGQLTTDRPGGEHPLKSRYFTWHQILGRLKDGVTQQQAETALQVLTQQIRQATPANTPEKIALLPGAQGYVENGVAGAGQPLRLLLGISGLVLLIACANLANLQLARASSRAREFAVRIALGASRARVLRGLLAESVLLSILGGGLGLLVAAWLTALLQRFQLPNQPFDLGGDTNLRLLAFTCSVSVATGIIFGLAPAWQASRTNPGSELKAGGGVTEGRGWRRVFRNALVVVQVALSLIVLVSAGLFARSLRKLQQVDPGFEPSRVVLMSLDLNLNSYPKARASAFYAQLLERTRALPGIEAATLAMSTPLSGRRPGMSVDRIDDYEPKPNEHMFADVNFVASDYFRTLRIPLLAGREFNASDMAGSPRVAIVDETFAQLYHPGPPSVGWKIFNPAEQPGGGVVGIEVVGIARGVRSRSLTESPKRMMFFPTTQQSWPSLTLAVRTGIGPAATIPMLRALISSLDPNLPVFEVRTLDEQRSSSLAFPRLTSMLLAGFSFLTLSLVALGLYGVLAYSVSQRTREIGVRLALGAQMRDIARLVLRHGFYLVLFGLLAGLGGALATATLLRGYLYGISSVDPLVFVIAPVVFVVVAVLACWLPARRATKVDPINALRAE
ncbi:MAG: ABC transporter permease [Opitutus sp.]